MLQTTASQTAGHDPRLNLRVLFWGRLLGMLFALLSLVLVGARPAVAQPTPVSLQGDGAQQLAGGANHACALTIEGAVHCWGANFFGQLGDASNTDRSSPVPVSGMASGVQAVVAGADHSCALSTAGAVACWGANHHGQLGDGSNSQRNTPVAVSGLGSGVVQITGGENHTCALTTAGAVHCWGSNAAGQLGDGSSTQRLTPVAVPSLGSGVQQVVAGAAHTCALSTTGGVLCWGGNSAGQLGSGSTSPRPTPGGVSGLSSGVQSIVSGHHHTCALTTAGAMLCWGYNFSGQLGDGANQDRTTPVAVSGLGSGVQAMAAGQYHSCAQSSSALMCWGHNSQGQLGDGSTTSRNVPVAVASLSAGVQAAAGGEARTCALTTGGAVQCWGYNGSGQLGDGSNTNRLTPVTVARLGSAVAQLRAGDSSTCALSVAGVVHCWGRNNYGQLGDGTSTNRSLPVAVSGLNAPVRQVSAGVSHACAVTSAGAVFCWGNNAAGQLGDGSSTFSSTPVAVAGLSSGVQEVAAGSFHTCALTTAGAVWCWGTNSASQLGDGTATNSPTPVAVSGLGSQVQAIAVGYNHSCALTTAGALLCWGNNFLGQLGDGTSSNRSTPVGVSGLGSGVQGIAAGSAHSCAVTTAGAAFCWGGNFSNQLGDGTSTNRITPVSVSGLSSGVQSLAVGDNHSCALTTAGAVQCWGYNDNGQLGDTTRTQRSTPVAATDLSSGVQAITVGAYHTCAQTTAGTVACFGSNFFGQLGNGSSTSRSSPTPILAAQSLAFPTQGTLRAGASISLTATASSTLAVTFDTWTPDVCTVSGSTLTALPGKAGYLCGVRARQPGGSAPSQARFVAAPTRSQWMPVQASVPAAPTGLTALAGDRAVKLSWTASASDHGSAILDYTVSGAPGGQCVVAASTTTCTIDGLTNGVGYTFTIKARNSLGNSIASASASATPQAYSEPVVALPGGGSAAVRVGAPPDCTVGSLAFNATVPPGAPAGARAPVGVLRFSAMGAGCGAASLSVRIDYPAGSLTGLTPYKFGSPTPGADPSWFVHGTLNGDSVSYTVTDNGVGDNDRTGGSIIDPFAPLLVPAQGSNQAIPTLNGWALALTALLAGALGHLGLRRRHRVAP